MATRTKKPPAYRSGTRGYQRTEEAKAELPQFTAQVPRELYDYLEELKKQWGVKTRNAVLARVLEEHRDGKRSR
jgi:hypothetical protein